jgi:hypothetical protein
MADTDTLSRLMAHLPRGSGTTQGQDINPGKRRQQHALLFTRLHGRRRELFFAARDGTSDSRL